MPEHESEVFRLLDDLTEYWSDWDEHEDFYLNQLAPELVADPAQGTAKERGIFQRLQVLLSEAEWLTLPQLIAEASAGVLRLSRSERAQREAEANVKKEIRRQLSSDFLGADAFFKESCATLVSEEYYQKEKLSFVKSWVTENTSSTPGGSKRTPDDEQVAAIASVHGHIQVVARAGSGKTATLVNRALFLLKHCGVAPSEMLLLAFNRKAALEIRRRLLALLAPGADAAVDADIHHRKPLVGKKKRINTEEIEASAVDAIAKSLNISLPHVMTFHALAYAIVHPEESILYNGAEGEAQGLSRAFQQVIDDHLQIPSFKKQIRELMLSHFQEDWERIVEGHYDQSREEFLRFRRSLARESLGGEYVKSYGEKLIANFLFEHDVAYKYERNHWWSSINYRPDFTVFKTSKSGVIIEYFGLSGDPDYDEMSDDKRAYWAAKEGWTLIDFSPIDITSEGANAFLKGLKKRLEDQGVPCVRLSEDEIWHRVRDRAIDRFTTAAVGFVGRCRKLSLSPTELQTLINSYSPLVPAESLFHELVRRLYVAYLDRLSATGEDDFDGLMMRAVEAIDTGQTSFQRKSGSGDLTALRYVCIDEFQDFSDLFYRLLTSVRKQNNAVELFCVGDDWQAINGFAGSDLRFFKNFEEHIGHSRRLHLSTNYRSQSEIVAVGNSLMHGLGKPAVAHKKSTGRVLISDINEFEPSLVEKQRHPGDIITPAVLRLTNKALADGVDVVMLCRRNAVPWFVNYQGQAVGGDRGLPRYLDLVRSFFPKGLRERVTISTAHKYKGLEKPMVIVLDAVARSYPLIHPNWIFSRILGDSPEKITNEERRLFYVALTRAAEALVLITDERRRSPFLEDLGRRQAISTVVWNDYPPVQGLTARTVVKIGNQERSGVAPTLVIKDLLKAGGYQWQSKGWPSWAKSFPTEGFKPEMLKSEVWAEPADGIEIRIYDDTETLLKRCLINGGNWNWVIDESQEQ